MNRFVIIDTEFKERSVFGREKAQLFQNCAVRYGEWWNFDPEELVVRCQIGPPKGDPSLMQKHHIREKDAIKIGTQKIKIREIILENHHLHNAVIDLRHLNTKQKVYNYSKLIDQE